MKMCHEYWYKYSDKDVPRSPLRKEVLKPVGLFICDGKAVSRTNPTVLTDTLSDTHSAFATTSPKLLIEDKVVPKKTVPPPAAPTLTDQITDLIMGKTDADIVLTSSEQNRTALFKVPSTTWRPSTAYYADNHFNRFKTPGYELDDDEVRAKRNMKIEKWTHLYHENNFVQKSVDPIKCQRLWLPSHKKLKTVERMWTESVGEPRDPPYEDAYAGTYKFKVKEKPKKKKS
jgi:hypothetical protein